VAWHSMQYGRWHMCTGAGILSEVYVANRKGTRYSMAFMKYSASREMLADEQCAAQQSEGRWPRICERATAQARQAERCAHVF
jgi:hypothetical protein